MFQNKKFPKIKVFNNKNCPKSNYSPYTKMKIIKKSKVSRNQYTKKTNVSKIKSIQKSKVWPGFLAPLKHPQGRPPTTLVILFILSVDQAVVVTAILVVVPVVIATVCQLLFLSPRPSTSTSSESVRQIFIIAKINFYQIVAW